MFRSRKCCASFALAAFISAAIAVKIFPVVQSLRRRPAFRHPRRRSDPRRRGDPGPPSHGLCVTLLLAEPEKYDGGELRIADKYGGPRGEAAGRRHCALARDPFAPGQARRARQPGRLFFRSIIREIAPARCCATSTRRSRNFSVERGVGDAACVRAEGYLPRPDPLLGGGLG